MRLQQNLTFFEDLRLFEGVDCVVHLAGRAHDLNGSSPETKSAILQANSETTDKLSQAASLCGVKRFIFLSSVGVHGNNSGERPFSEKSALTPHNSYAHSKLMAEKYLVETCRASSLDAVIFRPPLVYGPGVKGKFLSMLGWLRRGIPLPLGAIHNQRSLVGIDNLIDLIVTCIDHPAAANQTFLVSDGEDISTAQLLRRMSKALDKPARLFPLPTSLLQLGANLIGKQDIAHGLLGDLRVDISHTKKVLNWTPRFSVDEGLKRTAEWYLSQK